MSVSEAFLWLDDGNRDIIEDITEIHHKLSANSSLIQKLVI